MQIKFESHEDYALACKVLSSLVEDKKKFEDMVDLFFSASKELDDILIKDIYFPKNEIQTFVQNNKILWSYLETLQDSEGSKLESLVHSFSNIGFLAKKGILQAKKQ